MKRKIPCLKMKIRFSRRECVEIRGVPEHAGESTNYPVKEVGRALGVEVTDNDISVSHRLPPSKAYKSKKPAGPSPIIAKFVRRDMKEAFYRARIEAQRQNYKRSRTFRSE